MSAIRLNPNLLPDLLASIQRSAQNANVATEELASGRSVNQLSDNPEAVAALVGNHNQAGQDDQFLQNSSTLQASFQVADSSLSDVVTALTRAISLGTEGATSTVNASDRQAIAGEVQGLQSQLLSLANTTYQGKFLFAGTAVTTQPFTQDPVTGAVTYVGNTGVVSTQISNGDALKLNVPGSQLFQNAAGNAFTALQDLNTSLLSGNNIGAAVIEAQKALSQVSTQRVFYGNSLNQLTLSENFLNQDKVNLSTQENALVGADIAATATNLAQSQTDQQAVLSATGRILNLPTLLDFLK
jgi:flagellar hook-associated protein 3 FlgL